jgi:hypothetical protein
MVIWTNFVTRVEAELGRANCISWLLCDNGGVYLSKELAAFCERKGIQLRHSAPYAQWQNHTAERTMRTVGEMALTTMIHANFPRGTWGWAFMHAVDVINRSSESSLSNSSRGQPSKRKSLSATASRLERWRGISLPLQTKGLHPFGCLAFKHEPGKLRNKMDAHAPAVHLVPICLDLFMTSVYASASTSLSLRTGAQSSG